MDIIIFKQDFLLGVTKEHDNLWTRDRDESDVEGGEGGGEVISEPETPTVKCQACLPLTESKVLPNSNENARSLLLHYSANMV